MPISLRWHEPLPVLLITYSGPLKRADFEELCARREEVLAAGPPACVVVADVRKLAALPSEPTDRPCSTIARHSKVRQTVIVLPADLYRTVRGAIEATRPFALPVSFFADYDAALTHAIAMSEGLKGAGTA